jgi:predicted GH43/DUF377 family glycosyl hydrolase
MSSGPLPRASRRFKTTDIAERVGYLSPTQIRIPEYPLQIGTAFNPTFYLHEGILEVFTRASIGYFTYANTIVRFALTFPFQLAYGRIKESPGAELAICPDFEFDFWGCEDPRIVKHGDSFYMAYVGRRSEDGKLKGSVTITATSKNLKNWKKRWIFLPRWEVETCKNAFMVFEDRRIWYFFRPKHANGDFSLRIGRLPSLKTLRKHEGICEIKGDREVLPKAPFEHKIGWCAPPIRVGRSWLALIHGVDRKLHVYRIFAVLLNSHMQVTECTPTYIMEPKTLYERYGDRPYVVFPCGTARLDDELLISYGASDSFVAFAKLKIDEIPFRKVED